MNTGQENRFERGLSGRGETGPDIGIVTSEELAKKDRGHGSSLRMRTELEELSKLKREGVGIGLLAKVEEKLGFGTLLIGGCHEM